jgi:hypothetical protein
MDVSRNHNVDIIKTTLILHVPANDWKKRNGPALSGESAGPLRLADFLLPTDYGLLPTAP